MSVSRHTTSASARRPSSSITCASSRASSSVFMNAPSPTFTSSTIASRARSELLGHDRRRDQRDDVDRRGDVAQRVELLVGRDEVGGLADDRDADVAQLRDHLVDRQLDAEAGDRLELVERAAGVPEPAAAHLPERHAAGRDDRADGDRRLVPDATGRVLVDDLPAERRAEVERVAGADHRVGQRVRLGRAQPVEVDRHAPGGHLVVRHLVARVGEHELGQVSAVVLLAVALPLDQCGGTDHARLLPPRGRAEPWWVRRRPTSRRARRPQRLTPAAEARGDRAASAVGSRSARRRWRRRRGRHEDGHAGARTDGTDVVGDGVGLRCLGDHGGDVAADRGTVRERDPAVDVDSLDRGEVAAQDALPVVRLKGSRPTIVTPA